MNTGTIKQIVGPVVDVYFEHNIPEVEHALTVEWVGENKEKRKITLEEKGVRYSLFSKQRVIFWFDDMKYRGQI